MARAHSKNKTGATAVILSVVIIGIVGLLGYVVWGNNNSMPTSPSDQNLTVAKTKYHTVEISGHKFRYPDNPNNKKVIIVEGSSDLRQISYKPIRDYFAKEDVSVDCKDYIAGTVNAYSKQDAVGAALKRYYVDKTFNSALADETVVKVEGRELYLLGPVKQNELCVEIYESEDPELKMALSNAEKVHAIWLKSLELIE